MSINELRAQSHACDVSTKDEGLRMRSVHQNDESNFLTDGVLVNHRIHKNITLWLFQHKMLLKQHLNSILPLHGLGLRNFTIYL